MVATRCNIALVICLLLVFILMEGAKPVHGNNKLKKKVAKLEKKVNGIEEKLKCEPCLLIKNLTKRLTKIVADIDELKKPPTTYQPPPLPHSTSLPPSPTTRSAPECQNYKKLTSANRKTTYMYSYARKNPLCDDRLGPGWFRFKGDAGTQMPTSCPAKHSCRTEAPGWLNGAHPAVAEGKVTRQVCFHWTRKGCCEWSTKIQVRNCGSFYVYYFSGTPDCTVKLRYCSTD